MEVISELIDDFNFILDYQIRVVNIQKQLDAKAPRAGDLAPNFTLSSFRGKKPVVLVFGRFT